MRSNGAVTRTEPGCEQALSDQGVLVTGSRLDFYHYVQSRAMKLHQLVKELGRFKVGQPTYALSLGSKLHILPGMRNVNKQHARCLTTGLDHSSADRTTSRVQKKRHTLVIVHMAWESLSVDWRSL